MPPDFWKGNKKYMRSNLRNAPMVFASAFVVAISTLLAISPAKAATNFCKVTDLKTAGGMDALVAAARKIGRAHV